MWIEALASTMCIATWCPTLILVRDRCDAVRPARRTHRQGWTGRGNAHSRPCYAARAGATNVKFLKGAIEDISLPDSSIDVIISNYVINLSTDKPTVFAEAFRALTPKDASTSLTSSPTHLVLMQLPTQSSDSR
jgi:SAM-dependent methyltransferase